MEAGKLGVELELQLPGYTTAYGNGGFPHPLNEAGIKPATSWILVRFISTAPQRELQIFFFFNRGADIKMPWSLLGSVNPIRCLGMSGHHWIVQ